MKWDRFKQIVKMMRKMQEWLMYKEQGGCSTVMISIGVYHEKENDNIKFVPHRIDLRTGKVNAFNYLGQYKEYNIKELLKASEE